MSDKLAIYQELYNRGTVPPKLQPLINELVARGLLIPKGQGPSRGNVSVDNVVRGLSRGVPVAGSFLDELDAATNATLAPIFDPLLPDSFEKLPGKTWDERYEQALAIQRGEDQAFDDKHPALSTGLQITGGVASTIPMAATAAGKAALGLGGKTLGGMIARSAASGAGLGTLHGFGLGESTPEDRLNSSMAGGIVGGAVGAASPLLAKGAGWVVRKARPLTKRIGGLFGMGGGITPPTAAEKRLFRAFSDDAVDPAALKELGDDAMLLNAGPNLRQQAAVIAGKPGSGMKKIVDAVDNQAKGATKRVVGTIDKAVGPEWNIAQTVDDLTAIALEKSAPYYDEAMSTPIQMTPGLADLFKRPSVRRALNKAIRSVADETGEIVTPDAPNARLLHELKLNIDDMIEGAPSNEARRLLKLQRYLLKEFDTQVPAYPKARQIYGGPARQRSAMQMGQDVFTGGKYTVSPGELEKQLTMMSESELAAFRIGARGQIAQIMGTARNDAGAAIAQLYDKGWNKEKLALIIGEDGANAVDQMLKAQKKFAYDAMKVSGNSETYARTTAERELGLGTKEPGVIESLLNWPSTGLGTTARLAARKAGSGVLNSRYSSIGDQMADPLTASGVDLDKVLQRMLELRSDEGLSLAQRKEIERMVRALTAPAPAYVQ